MSDPHNARLSPSAIRAVLVAALCAGCTDAVEPGVDLIVPIQIVATPDRDTLKLADSLVLVVVADSGQADRVVWTFGSVDDSVVADTLVYRPQAAGTEFIRAVASFPGEREGAAVRRVVTRPNGAPSILVVPLGGEDYSRVPLGDTIELVAQVNDPDGDTIPAGSIQWYRTAPDGSPLPTPAGGGDTLRIPVATLDTVSLRVVVTDPAGANAVTTYTSIAYDPGTPGRWRRRIPGGNSTLLSRHPNGLIIVHDGQKRDGDTFNCSCTVTALTDGGTLAWTYSTGPAGTPVVIGDDGGIYLGREDLLVRLNPDGTEAWTSPGAAIGPGLMQDGAVAVVNEGVFTPPTPPRRVRVVETTGTERWSADLDSMTLVVALVVGADSTLYVLGDEGGGAFVHALAPDGTTRWLRRLFRRNIIPSVSGIVPADDSTLLVTALDSVFALRADGSTRWTIGGGSFSQPAIGYGRAFFGVNNAFDLVAVDLATGQEVWRLALDGRMGAPLLNDAGEVLVPAGAEVVAADAGTGAERWRHAWAGNITTALLLTAGGDLLAGDLLGYVESVAIGAGPLASPWPMPWADERRTGRARLP